jgi:dienelactone hydrolase
MKYFGKEKIADGPDDPAPLMQRLRKEVYGGQAFANALAKQGFVVLVHDTFLWGSRRFPLETMPADTQSLARDIRRGRMLRGRMTNAIELYDIAARHHESMIGKYCTLLGTTLAGVVSYEDRAATRYLQSRPDVLPESIGCIGLSGGGCRAGLLAATCPQMKATVIVSMMSTYEQFLDQHADGHTWMFFPTGLARHGDWSDLVASQAPTPLFVQYNRYDPHFPLQGMQEAHQRIAAHYQNTNRPDAYRGKFYNGHHQFDLHMQAEAFA